MYLYTHSDFFVLVLTALLLLTQNVAVEHKIIIKQKKSEKKSTKRICFIKINFSLYIFLLEGFLFLQFR